MRIVTWLTMVAMLSACAQSSRNGNTHAIQHDHRYCDINCQRSEDEIIRRGIEDGIIAEDVIADDIFEAVEY